MDVSPIKSVKASELTLEQLSMSSTIDDAGKTKELSRQFEAILVRQILQNAYKTVIPSKFTSESSVTGIYQDMITFQTAESVTKSNSLGVAQSLENQLTNQLLTKSSKSLASMSDPEVTEND